MDRLQKEENMPRSIPAIVIAVSLGLVVASHGLASETSKPSAKVDGISKASKQGARPAIKGESTGNQKLVGPSDSKLKGSAAAKSSQKLKSDRKVIGEEGHKAGAKSGQKMKSDQKIIGEEGLKAGGALKK
jgi:hypothetical protein